METKRKRVLIVCTANACRSQMAEGLWRHFAGNRWEVFSAGLRPTRVHPLAIRAMDEIGIDIREQRSESIDDYRDQHFDLIVTVCDSAQQACPTLPHVENRLHWSFPDPDAMPGSEEERLRVFRNVRDQITWKLKSFLQQVEGAGG